MPGQSVCFMCLKDKAVLYIEYLNPLSTNSPDINMSLKKMYIGHALFYSSLMSN